MECIQLTIPGMEVAKTSPKESATIMQMQDDMRKEMMRRTSELLPAFFDKLANMKDSPDFMKIMMQVLKFSIPTIKAEEMERLPDMLPNELLEQKYRILIK